MFVSREQMVSEFWWVDCSEFEKSGEARGFGESTTCDPSGIDGFCFWANIIYKASGYNGKIWFMVMPCNIYWTLRYVNSQINRVYVSCPVSTIIQLHLPMHHFRVDS